MNKNNRFGEKPEPAAIRDILGRLNINYEACFSDRSDKIREQVITMLSEISTSKVSLAPAETNMLCEFFAISQRELTKPPVVYARADGEIYTLTGLKRTLRKIGLAYGCTREAMLKAYDKPLPPSFGQHDFVRLRKHFGLDVVRLPSFMLAQITLVNGIDIDDEEEDAHITDGADRKIFHAYAVKASLRKLGLNMKATRQAVLRELADTLCDQTHGQPNAITNDDVKILTACFDINEDEIIAETKKPEPEPKMHSNIRLVGKTSDPDALAALRHIEGQTVAMTTAVKHRRHGHA